MKLKSINLFFTALMAFSFFLVLPVAAEQTVILKREIVSRNPSITVLKFYLNDKVVAKKTITIDAEKYLKEMETLMKKKDTTALNAMAVKQPVVSIESEGEIPDGKVKEYGPSGQLSGIYTYQNNKQNGDFKIYYPNGRLMQEGNSINDELRDVKQYYENGQLRVDASYLEGGDIRSAKYFSETGKLLYQK